MKEQKYCVNCINYQHEEEICNRDEHPRPARLERHPTGSYMRQLWSEGKEACSSLGNFFKKKK